MRERLSVLVLGVGGNVGQGILKALALASVPCRVVGACVSPLSFGLYTADRALVSPLAADPSFLEWLIATCKEESIDAVLSGVEPVLDVLAEHADTIRRETGAVVVVSSRRCLDIGGDKLATCQWLQDKGLNYPRFADAEQPEAVEQLAADVGFPLLAKPRRGKGSHGVLLASTRDDLRYVARAGGYVVQENLGDPGQEYTAGCFCDRDGRVRGSIVMRRDLLEGTTVRAETGDFPEVRAEAERLAAALGPAGPCNIQMRLHEGRAVCFEINVRFSGTTPVRARLGYNEVEAALRHFVLGEPAVDLPRITQGTMLRYWNEMYVSEEAKAQLTHHGFLDRPRAHPIQLEDYGTRP